MWRFWVYRTTDPVCFSSASPAEVPWNTRGPDPLTHIDLAEATEDVTAVWRYHHHWTETGQPPPPRPAVADLSSQARQKEADRLFAQLRTKHDEGESVRKAGVYGLGDTSPLSEEVLQDVVTRLKADPSVYVRHVAAGTLGCLGRRAIATGFGVSLVPACLEGLVYSLSREANRLSMDQAQGGHIHQIRPIISLTGVPPANPHENCCGLIKKTFRIDS